MPTMLCSPNAVNYTLRDSMVVRAAAALPPGTELCINYLGRGALRPLSQRQLELEACYGFKCSCPRCVAQQHTQFTLHACLLVNLLHSLRHALKLALKGSVTFHCLWSTFLWPVAHMGKLGLGLHNQQVQLFCQPVFSAGLMACSHDIPTDNGQQANHSERQHCCCTGDVSTKAGMKRSGSMQYSCIQLGLHRYFFVCKSTSSWQVCNPSTGSQSVGML